ncbi:MAG: aldo/keto reductase [Eubacteriales bacterium]
MIYTDFQGKRLSMLGFGTMRLPTQEDKSIDEAQTAEMVRYAIEHGVNYFDTAYPYHGGMSEVVIGRVLKEYPRESWYLADKYPGHQISSSYDPAAIFEEQLTKCGVDYFDFYLLHNVYENSIGTYLNPKWGIIDYFHEQKRLGRIRHLGFSAHGSVENLRTFLDACGEDMEFCQIQLNYLDWTLQNAKEKVEVLNERNIPIWVMEPVRGGRLCRLNEKDEAVLKQLRPDESIPAWGFRFLQAIPGVQMVLSGMSDMAQMEDNVKTFFDQKPLGECEKSALLSIAEGMKDSVPCTACRYCTAECPMKLDIPTLLATYNEIRFSPAINVAMRMEGLPAEKQPSACIGCGKCAKMCPQKIDIPEAMKDFAEKLAGIPKWADICRQRDEAAKRVREGR